MTENFTQAQGLIRTITSEGLLANPAGIEGHKVLVLEKVGDQGSRYYCTLEPGQTLRLGERLFSKYEALAVDMRYGLSFQVSGQFATRDRGHKVTVNAKVRFHVTDAGILAMKAVDPLGELRDKVVAALNRDLAQYPEAQINAGLVEKVIRNVGQTPHLGLTIEDADVSEFSADAGITEHVVRMGGAQSDIAMQELRNQADLRAKELANDADIRMRRARHDNIGMTDINVLIHEHPELLPAIFGHFASRDEATMKAQLQLMTPVIQAYIDQKNEAGDPIDPDELAKLIKRTINTRTGIQGPMEAPKQISWGGSENTPSSENGSVVFGDEKRQDENIIDGKFVKKSDKNNSDSTQDDTNNGRIKFGGD